MSRIVLLDPKLTPTSISAIFKQKKIFSFSKFLGCLTEKVAAATPLIDQFAKIWSEHVKRIKTTNHKVWASQSKSKRFLIGSFESGYPGL